MRPVALTLLLSLGAAAQERPSAPPPPPDLETDAASAPQGAAPVEAARLTPGLNEFLSGFLSYDELKGDAFLGRERRPLARSELYQRLGRPDLSERIKVLTQRRHLFFIVGGVSAVAGLAVGAVGFAGAPDLNSEACVVDPTHYNACVDSYRSHQIVGAVGVATAITAAIVFLGTGAMMDLEPIPRDETQALVSQYNRELLRKGRGQSEKKEPINLVPTVSPQGAGLATSFRF